MSVTRRRSSTDPYAKRMTPPAKRLLPPCSSSLAASSIATFAPWSFAASAAHNAALPLPTTTTSYSCFSIGFSIAWIVIRYSFPESKRSLDSRRLDDAGKLRRFARQKFREPFRRARDHRHAVLGEAAFQLGQIEREI